MLSQLSNKIPYDIIRLFQIATIILYQLHFACLAELPESDELSPVATFGRFITPTMANTCPICVKICLDSDEGICCGGACRRWFHRSCMGMRVKQNTCKSPGTLTSKVVIHC